MRRKENGECKSTVGVVSDLVTMRHCARPYGTPLYLPPIYHNQRMQHQLAQKRGKNSKRTPTKTHLYWSFRQEVANVRLSTVVGQVAEIHFQGFFVLSRHLTHSIQVLGLSRHWVLEGAEEVLESGTIRRLLFAEFLLKRDLMPTFAQFPLPQPRPKRDLLSSALSGSPEYQWGPLPSLGLLPRPLQPLVDVSFFVAEDHV